MSHCRSPPESGGLHLKGWGSVKYWNSDDFSLPIHEPASGLEDDVYTPTKKSGVGAGFAVDLKYVTEKK